MPIIGMYRDGQINCVFDGTNIYSLSNLIILDQFVLSRSFWCKNKQINRFYFNTAGCHRVNRVKYAISAISHHVTEFTKMPQNKDKQHKYILKNTQYLFDSIRYICMYK